jgi:cation diffusion facilitator CzcD-associated flavoprotein CzcO
MKADYQVGIIGAGFGGLVAALELKKADKTDFIIFERASEIGGTWRDNTYPGCACDVPSHLYSLTAAPNPEWSLKFSTQPEIFNYLKNVVAKNDLAKHIRLNTDIVEIQFIETGGFWQVTDRTGSQTTVKALISATGPLNRPVIPKFQGLDEFKGEKFHSSEWDKTCIIKGKRVAIIGTGASSIQIVPAIAPDAAQLYVFQRTPAWIAPRMNRKISGFEKKLYKNAPFMQKGVRELLYWINEFLGKAFIGHKNIHKLSEFVALQKLKQEVIDPEIRQKLTPPYKLGCKRVLLSDDYYPAFNRQNVSLLTDSIEKITSDSIITKNGQTHPVDIIIFATGFEAAEVGIYTKIMDKNGQNLIDYWAKTGVEAHKGTTVSGYPNLLFMLGPNTGLGHNSVIHMMESQMVYMLQYLELLEHSGEKAYLDVKPNVQKAHNEWLQSQFAGTVWDSGCQSWYRSKNGRITTLYPRLTVQFRKEMQKIKAEDYHIVKNTDGVYKITQVLVTRDTNK